jgi:hypothetical protein
VFEVLTHCEAKGCKGNESIIGLIITMGQEGWRCVENGARYNTVVMAERTTMDMERGECGTGSGEEFIATVKLLWPTSLQWEMEGGGWAKSNCWTAVSSS